LNTRLFTTVGIIASIILYLLVPQLKISADNGELLDPYQEKKDKIEEKIEEFEGEAEKTKKDKKKTEEELEKIKKEIERLEEDIYSKQQEINDTKKQIESTSDLINSLESDMKTKEKELEKKAKEIEEQKKMLGESLSFMYENRNLSIFEFIFNSDNLSEVINAFDFMNIISDENEKVHDRIIAEQKELKLLKEEIENNKEEKEAELKEQEKLKAKQETEEKEFSLLLSEQEEKELKASKHLGELEYNEEKIQEEIIKQMEEVENIIKENEREVERIKKEEERKRKEEEERRRREKEKNNEQNNNNNTRPQDDFVGNIGEYDLQNPLQPGYRFTSSFGYRIHPKTGVRTFHNGVDLAAPIGTPIFAAGDGVVLFAGPASGFGNWVVIAHDNGLYTIYGHMRYSSIIVEPGQYVSRGQHIAGIGNEGFSTGPHLHFEVANGRSGTSFNNLDPERFIKFR